MSDHIEQRHNTFYATLYIPKALRPMFGGKVKFQQTLKTDSRSKAIRLAAPIVALWKAEIERTKRGSKDINQADMESWQEALRKAGHTDSDEQQTLLEALSGFAEKLEEKKEGSGVDYYKRATGERIDTLKYLDAYLDSLEHENTPKTIDMKRSAITSFAKHFPTLDKIERRSVNQNMNDLATQEGWKQKTVGRVLSFYRGYWVYLQSLDVVPEDLNPFDKLKIKSVRSTPADRRIAWKPVDLVAMWKAAVKREDDQLADLIQLGMWTGARIDELTSLKLSDIREDEGIRYLAITDAKTDAGWRMTPIHSKLIPLVDRLKGNRKDGYLLEGLGENKYGSRYNAIQQRFGRLRTSLGHGPTLVFHSIRHTFVTLLENSGVPENVAADIVGHEKKTITYGVYSHGNKLQIQKDALERIGYPGM